MILVKEKKPFKRTYFCECEQCEQCLGGMSPTISVDDIYDVIKNPPPAPIGVITDGYKYE